MNTADEAEDLLRRLVPQVLGTLIRRYGGFDSCEDALQEALLAATVQWPDQGIPDHPAAWLITVAARRLSDARRNEAARARRESTSAAMALPDELITPAPDHGDDTRGDDTLTLLLLCCHPALSPSTQTALTLRAVGGLTTAQIARAFLIPEPTMGQRISRAKQRIKAAGARFQPLPVHELADRLRVVRHVLYLIFNEGYTATSGPDLQRVDLTAEAIRLTRALHRARPDDGETAGLLALQLLTEARHGARTGPEGILVPLADQDRTQWNQELIAEGIALLQHTLTHAPIGPYQVQAAIAAVHTEARTAEDTDWPQILQLYRLLRRLWPNPVVTLNHAIALAMVHGPKAGLDMLTTLESDDRVADHHRLHAVRAHLQEMTGDHSAARASYLTAARRTTSLPEQRYLTSRAARLPGDTISRPDDAHRPSAQR